MMKNAKKLVWAGVSALVVAVAVFAWQPAYTAFIDWYLSAHCRDWLGGELKKESIVRKEDCWVISAPSILNAMNVAGVNFDAQAERIDLSYSFHPMTWELELQVVIDHPVVTVTENDIDWDTLIMARQGMAPLIKIVPKVLIKNGEIRFLQGESVTEPLYYDVDIDLSRSRKAVVNAGLTPSKEELKVSIEREGRRYQVAALLNQFDLAPAFKGLQVLAPGLSEWEVNQGRISGEWRASFGRGRKPAFGCELTCSDLAVSHPEKEASLKLSQFSFTLAETTRRWQLQISDAASMRLAKGGEDFWEVVGLTGEIDVTPRERAEVQLRGLCRHDGKELALNVEGGGYFADENQEASSIALRLIDEKGEGFSTRLFARQLGQGCDCYEAEVRSLTENEFSFLQHLLVPTGDALRDVAVSSGKLDVDFIFFVENGCVSDVKLEKIHATQVEATALPWNVECHLGTMTGSLSLNMEEDNLLDRLDGELLVQSSSVAVEGWKLENIETQLHLKEGLLQPSHLKGSFAGMTGTMDLDSSSMNIDFSGPVIGLAKIGPKSIQEGVIEEFSEDQARVSARIRRTLGSIQVVGNLTFETDRIEFGFDLEKKPTEAWAACPRKKVRSEGLFEMPLIDRELNIAGFWVQNGWFEAKELSLKRYVAPFFLDKERLTLRGVGDFHGTFDQQGILVKYDAEDLQLESSDFLITIPKVASETEGSEVWGVHEVDFIKGENRGLLPARAATYHEKNSDLIFSDINARIELTDHAVKIPHIEAFCQGLYFAGNIDVNLNEIAEKKFDVAIHTQTVSGQFSNLQNLFSHFDQPLFFLKVPFESQLSYQQNGADLSFSFYPGGYDFQAHVEGSLTDGIFRLEQKKLLVEDVSLDFVYDYKQDTLECKDLNGTLLLGKPDRVEEYQLAADHIRFNDFSNHRAQFDIWLGDKKRDVVRLVGSTEPITREEGTYIQFQFDQELSHLGAVHPSELSLVMKDWTTVDSFGVELDFKLQTLFHDLQRVGRTGFIPFSRHIAHKLEEWQKAEGMIHLNCSYAKDQGVMRYALLGEGVSIDDYSFNQLELKGGKSGEHWMVDQLKLDEWSFAADVTPREEEVKVNFLGITFGQSLLLGLEGIYSFENKFFDGTINLLEAQLDESGSWDFGRAFAENYAPKGRVKATGKITVDGATEKSGVLVDALLDTSIKDFEIKGFKFSQIESASCHLTTDRGLTFRRVQAETVSADFKPCTFYLERVDFNLTNQDFSIEGLAFDFPQKSVRPFLEQFKNSFPDLVNQSFIGACSELKDKGRLKGTLDLEVTSPHYALKIGLEEGCYQFAGQQHELSDIVLEYDPCEFKLTTQYLLRDHYYWMQVISRSKELDQGELTFSQHHPDHSVDTHHPLTVHWCCDDQLGYYVERIFGNLVGLDFDLVRDSSRSLIHDAIYLEGEVALAGDAIHPLVSPETKEQLELWGLGGGYHLKGRWEVHLPKGEEETELYFHGDFLGKNFVCKGYQIDTLNSKIDLSPQFITIRNLEITDPAGILYADQVEFFVNQMGRWVFSVPQAQVNDFWPSMLREVGSSYAPVRKPLVVNRIELNGFKGEVADSTSIVGDGKLLFSNPPKKNLQNNILTIPSEILSRIGLDLKVLNPVTGSIFYDIHDKKIFLTRFKDIFSEGKLSKFYLPNTDYNSYVDFTGNLHVQVKMKQYNLVFKLAELFTVTIQGTLLKPKYTLQKQQSRD